MSAQQRHTWVIDALEEGTARVEEDGAHMITIPRYLLPSAAREGRVLQVQRDESDPSRITLAISVDEKATTAALDRSRATTQAIASASRKRDPGGDVVL